MSRPNRRRTFIVSALLGLSLAACNTASTEGAAKKDAAPTTGNVTAAVSCEGASLTMTADQVVAKVNGVDVKAADLGEELPRMEQKALRSYCASVAEARSLALENHVNETLIKAAAEKEGKSPEDYVRGRIEAAMTKQPTDEELLKFYEENKGPGAPPFEQVKMQVAMAMQREAGQNAMLSMLDELRGAAQIETKLPDVSPPALNVDVPSHTATKGGTDAAKVTVVEFADFECPYCSRAADTMSALKDKYGDKVRLAYRHFPLSFHPNARKAAEYSQCAKEQGKFWGFHDKAYEGKSGLEEEALRGYATEVGLDLASLDDCLKSGVAAKQVDQDVAKAQEIGVEGTPTFFINGKPFLGSPSKDGLSAAIDAVLAN